jgi:signal transduction histidine kinase
MELRDARLAAEEQKTNFAGAVQKVFELQTKAAELRRGLEEALEKEKSLAEQLRESRAETEKLNGLLRDAKTGLSLEKEMNKRSAARINTLLAEGESLRETLRKADDSLRETIKKLRDRDASIALLKQELARIDRLQEEVEDLKRRNMRLSGLIKREQFDFTEKIIKGLSKISGDLNLFSYRLPAAARKNLAPSLKAMLASVTLMKGWQAYIDETPLHLERGELRSMLDGLLDGWERPFRNKKLSLSRQVILPSAWIKMDREKLRLAFYQVIKNAHENLPPGTSLKMTMTGTEDRSKAVVIFEDNGHGFPAEVLDRLYLPFNTSRKDATGIGLATAHRILERHGGEFTVSNRKERGAAAMFILPLDWGALPPSEEPKAKEAQRDGAPPPPPPPPPKA